MRPESREPPLSGAQPPSHHFGKRSALPLALFTAMAAPPGVFGEASLKRPHRCALIRWRPRGDRSGITSTNDSLPSSNPITPPSISLITLNVRQA